MVENELLLTKDRFSQNVKEVTGDEAEELQSGWKKSGHQLLGKRAVRIEITKSKHTAIKGTILKWRPATSENPCKFILNVEAGRTKLKEIELDEKSAEDSVKWGISLSKKFLLVWPGQPKNFRENGFIVFEKIFFFLKTGIVQFCRWL